MEASDTQAPAGAQTPFLNKYSRGFFQYFRQIGLWTVAPNETAYWR